MDDERKPSWVEQAGSLASLGLTVLLLSIMVQRYFGVNVWAWLAEQVRAYRDRARELAIIRKMWRGG